LIDRRHLQSLAPSHSFPLTQCRSNAGLPAVSVRERRATGHGAALLLPPPPPATTGRFRFRTLSGALPATPLQTALDCSAEDDADARRAAANAFVY
jgi:hypothetical protein